MQMGVVLGAICAKDSHWYDKHTTAPYFFGYRAKLRK